MRLAAEFSPILRARRAELRWMSASCPASRISEPVVAATEVREPSPASDSEGDRQTSRPGLVAECAHLGRALPFDVGGFVPAELALLTPVVEREARKVV